MATTTLTVYFRLITRPAQTENEITGISKADSIERAGQENRNREFEPEQRDPELKEKVLKKKDDRQSTKRNKYNLQRIFRFKSYLYFCINNIVECS